MNIPSDEHFLETIARVSYSVVVGRRGPLCIATVAVVNPGWRCPRPTTAFRAALRPGTGLLPREMLGRTW